MDKVLNRSSKVMIILYFIIGIFGYLTFADDLNNSLLHSSTSGNILECNYNRSELVQLARFFVVVAIISSSLFCFIPAK